MIQHRNDSGQIALVIFARDDNGMIISAVEGAAMRFGEDPTKTESRMFVDMGDAVDYAKVKCREYCGRLDVDFLVKEGDPMVRSANQAQMPRRQM